MRFINKDPEGFGKIIIFSLSFFFPLNYHGLKHFILLTLDSLSLTASPLFLREDNIIGILVRCDDEIEH